MVAAPDGEIEMRGYKEYSLAAGILFFPFAVFQNPQWTIPGLNSYFTSPGSKPSSWFVVAAPGGGIEIRGCKEYSLAAALVFFCFLRTA